MSTMFEAQARMCPPMPRDWGKPPHGPPSDGKFSGMIEKKLYKEWFRDMKADLDEGCKTEYATSRRRAALICIQGALTNNEIARDIWLVEGAVDILKELAEYEWGSESPATCTLGRMGFKEYDTADDDNRAKYTAKYQELWPQGKGLPRGPEDGIVPNFHRVMIDAPDVPPKRPGTEKGPHGPDPERSLEGKMAAEAAAAGR